MKIFKLVILLFGVLHVTTPISTNEDYKISPASLKNLIIKNGVKNNIIYTYTDWCSPCIKEFPNVLNFCKKNNCKLYIIVLSKDGNADLNKYQEKLKKKYNCTDQLYNFSFNKEISNQLKKSNYRNYQAFIKELLEEKYNSKMLYGSDNIILINDKSKIVYVPEYLEYETIFMKLKELLI